MNTKELIDRIFKEPGVKFELTEFENLGKPIHDIVAIYPKAATTGKDAGKTIVAWMESSIFMEGECFVNQRVCHLSPRSDMSISPEYAVS